MEKLSLKEWCTKHNRDDILKRYAKENELHADKIWYAENVDVWWICKTHNVLYPMKLKQKTRYNHGCKVCSSRYLVKGINDLKTFCLKEENKNKFGHLIYEWSDLNSISMDEVFPNYTEKVYWECPKCGYGKNKEWYVEPNSRINNGNNCPNCSSELRKSHAEKVVYYYVKKVFPNAIENYKIPDTDQLEIDIFVEELSLGIEYDGSYWHNKKPEKDQEKYKICKDKNIKLLRLREKGCKDISDIATNCYYLKSHNNKDLNNAIQYVFEYIKSLSTNDFIIPQIDWEKDFSEIEELIELQVKDNSVAKYQLLKEQWHPDLNGKTTPDRVYAQSNTKRYWRCLECGYGNKDEWHVSPNSRIKDSKNNKISGCPACANKKLYKGYNDFETFCNKNEEYKFLLKDWDEIENNKRGIKKDNIKFNSTQIVYWECDKCHHKWKSKLNDRTIKNRDCKVCIGKEVKQGVNDIATTHPEIAEQWDKEKNIKESGRTKYNTSKGYKKKIWWICEKGHSFDASPNDRTNKVTGCRYCSNKDVLYGFNDLETFCNKEENKDANIHLLEEWYKYNKLKPSEVVWGSDKVVKWKCSNPECEYEWETAVRHRVTYIQKNGKLHKGTGCDKCARKQKAIELRMKKTKGKELSKINPKLAKEWHPDPNKNYDEKRGFILTPDNTAVNSHDIVWWKCHVCLHEWQKDVKYRNLHQKKCPICNYSDKIEKIRINMNGYDTLSSLVMPYLKGKVCHFTKKEYFYDILREKYIKYSDKRDTCFGYKHKYVCLADFRNIENVDSENKDFKEILGQVTEYIFVLKQDEFVNIIQPKDEEYYLTHKNEGWFIPNFECWYNDKLYLDKIEKIYIINKIFDGQNNT